MDSPGTNQKPYKRTGASFHRRLHGSTLQNWEASDFLALLQRRTVLLEETLEAHPLSI